MKIIINTKHGYFTKNGDPVNWYKLPKGDFEMPSKYDGYVELATHIEAVAAVPIPTPVVEKTSKEIFLEMLKDNDIKNEIKKIKNV